jgi:hypothetical protein
VIEESSEPTDEEPMFRPAEPPPSEFVRAPDTGSRGYAVKAAPVFRAAFGRGLPRFLKLVSTALGEGKGAKRDERPVE